MLRRVLQLTGSPRTLLRSVLALDDSPHAIALGVAIGIFVGLTPSVGVQTIMVLAIVVLTRPFFYFNGTAAMASTYISNPVTMAPMYYFWYRLGASVLGSDANVNFDALLEFEGLAGWWAATTALAVKVGWPMLLGALLTAPIGAVIAYPVTHYLISKWRAPAPESSIAEPMADELTENGRSDRPAGNAQSADDPSRTTASAGDHKHKNADERPSIADTDPALQTTTLESTSVTRIESA